MYSNTIVAFHGYGCSSMIDGTHAVLGGLHAYVLYFCISTYVAQLSIFLHGNTITIMSVSLSACPTSLLSVFDARSNLSQKTNLQSVGEQCASMRTCLRVCVCGGGCG